MTPAEIRRKESLDGAWGIAYITGGTLRVGATTGTSSSNSAANDVVGTLTMTSGSLLIDNATGIPDRRISVSGNVNITGGAVTSSLVGVNGSFGASGPTNTLSPTTFDTDLTVNLQGGTQSLTTDKTLGSLTLRGGGASLTKTITSTVSGTGIGQIVFINNQNNGTTTLAMGSNLTSVSLPNAANFGGQGGGSSGSVNFGIDTGAGFILDLSGNGGTYTPNRASNSTPITTNYTFSGSGRIKATNFNFTVASAVNVGAGLTLEAIVPSGTVNLGGVGTIDPTSTFVYNFNGTGITHNVVSPVTLNTNRNVGNIEIARGGINLADTTLPFVNANPGSKLLIGNAVSPSAANADSTNIGLRVTSPATDQNLPLSRDLDFSQISSSYVGRQRITFNSSSDTDESILTLSGAVLLPSAPGASRRQEFTAINSLLTIDLTGIVSGDNSAGVLVNGSNSGLGRLRLSNAGSSFLNSITVTNGTLLIGASVPSTTGPSAIGSSGFISLADGATAASNWTTSGTGIPGLGQNGNPALLTDGAFTVNRTIVLGNAAFFTGGNAPTSAGNGVPNSYVLGGNSVSASSLGGNVAVSISVADKLLNITQATGGAFTLAGTIAPNADVTGLLNVEINAQQGLSAGSNSDNYLFSANAGTVILTGANAYDGTTTVTQGSLLIDGDQSGATGAVTVKSSAFLGGNGASGGDVTTQSGAGLTTTVRDWTGAAGVGFDDLSVGAFNAGSVPINLKIETAGIVNFSETAKSFTILNTTGITNFNPANVTITAPGFTGTGTWSLAQSGTSLVLSYAAVSSSAYDTWISQGAFNTPPLSAADKLPGADPDGDGRSNILEFALNGNPVNSSNSGLIASLIQNSSGPATNELTLVAAVRDGATFASGPNGVQIAAVAGITYTIEGSLNLVFPASAVSTTGPSNTAPGATGLPSLAGTDWEYRTFKLDASEGLAGKGFLRLKVTQP